MLYQDDCSWKRPCTGCEHITEAFSKHQGLHAVGIVQLVVAFKLKVLCHARFQHFRRFKDSALHWAAYKGHAEIVQALLQAGANPVSAVSV